MSNLALYTITVLIWGTTWMAIEFQLGVVPPEVSVFYRYGLASAMLFAWSLARGHRLAFEARAHGHFALLGLLLFSLNYILTYYAQQYISSALTAIAFSTMLGMNILNSRLFFGTRVGRSVLAGSALGIAGIGALFVPEVEELSLADATLYGTGIAVVGAFVASLGNMVSQSAQKQSLPVVQSNAWGMLYGTILTGIVALVQARPFVFDASIAYIASLVYLAVFGSIVGFGTYLTLLGRIGASKAGYAMVMFPVVAIGVSILSGEISPTWNALAGITLVVAGNVLVLRSRDRATTESRPQAASGQYGRYVLQKPR